VIPAFSCCFLIVHRAADTAGLAAKGVDQDRHLHASPGGGRPAHSRQRGRPATTPPVLEECLAVVPGSTRLPASSEDQRHPPVRRSSYPAFLAAARLAAKASRAFAIAARRLSSVAGAVIFLRAGFAPAPDLAAGRVERVFLG
jgi:hypothetical protein